MVDDAPRQASAAPGADELREVRKMVALFLTAMKNYTLYPADHNIARKFLQNIKSGLDVFLAKYGVLRFDVTKDTLLYQGQPVHEDLAGEGLAFALFKDGIIWIEFLEGLALEEIVTFFQVLHTYQEQQEEAGGDVVTALWDLSLPHLRYEATDVLWEADTILDIKLLNRGSVYNQNRAVAVEADAPPFEGMAEKFDEAKPCVLSDNEQQALRQMVLSEENKDSNEGALDVLLIILQDQRQPADFEIALAFLRDEFFAALAQGELDSCLNLLENLRVLMMSSQGEHPWAVSLLEKFFLDISALDGMAAFNRFLPGLDSRNQVRLVQLGKLLCLFDPVVIGMLAQLLGQVSSSAVAQPLYDAIETLASQDMQPLEKIFKAGDEKVIARLVPVLGRLSTPQAAQMLQKLIRHPAETVRRAAVTVFLQGSGREAREVLPLIDDHSSVIRDMALRFLGRARNVQVEKLLLAYLEKTRSRSVAPHRLIPVFDALGRCGGPSCLPFLQRILLGQGWNWFHGFGKPLYRRGAAVALAHLAMPEAEETLARAAGSVFPVVRAAVKAAEGAS